jgi:L-ascorbate metabolism protein UlaG (beta-lactamase superfamily)
MSEAEREGADPLPPAVGLERRVLARLRDLDEQHRLRLHGLRATAPGAVLSLGLLRTALRNLLRRPRHRRPDPVPRPAPGVMAVTFVGHATVMLTTQRARLLTDPFFSRSLWGVRRAEAPSLHRDDALDVDLVLLSHGHRDRLHLPSLRRLPSSAVVVVPPRCEGLLEPLARPRVLTLAPGERMSHGDLVITAVSARHDGARGLLDRTWRGACGYVVEGQGVAAYFAGDTAYYSGFAEVGRRLRPDVALLPIAGYRPLALRAQHMSPLDALAAFEDLGAALLVPIAHGAFPLGYESIDEPLSWLRALCADRGITDRLRGLAPGETCLVRRRMDAPAPPAPG